MTPGKRAERNARVLELFDSGMCAPGIAEHIRYHVGTVYSILRVHRPGRPRKQRVKSPKARAIRILYENGFYQSEIARIVSKSRQYVSAVLHR